MTTSFKKIIFSVLLSGFVIGCAVKESLLTEGFSINSQSFAASDVLILSVSASHPKNLAVYSPSGQMYVLHSEDDGIKIMPYSNFNDTEIIEIDLSNAMGITWLKGQKKEEKVITESGEYQLYMADNLETEPENTFHYSVIFTVE